MKEIFTAASVEEAKEKAAQAFEASIEDIEFTVIEEPKKGLFGKVKGDARVEATYEKPLTKADAAVGYIRDVLEKMGIENVSVVATDCDDGIDIEIGGDGFEDLIGRRGELLDALQYLSSLVCNKIDREYFRISTDCNGFRERRKEYLEETAVKIANSVKKSGRSRALEPMNPYERRIVHAAVSQVEGVTSKSRGDEPYRKVVISSTERRSYNSKGGYRGKGRKGGRGGKPKSHYDITTSFEKDYKRPKPEDDLDLGSGLYGKIEI